MIWDKQNKKNITLILTFFLTLLFAFVFINSALTEERPTLYWGSSGSSVKIVQGKLSAWGYFNGAADGSYGNDTFQAVKKFQSKNGLNADGVVGDSTWNALGFSTATPAQTTDNSGGYAPTKGVSRNDDINLLARLVDAEAESEPYLGKVAVAATILNRVQNAEFPKTISGNIFKQGEFESVSNGRINSISPSSDAVRATQDAFNGYDPTYGALYFWNPSKPVSGWIWSRQIIVRYANHVFAR